MCLGDVLACGRCSVTTYTCWPGLPRAFHCKCGFTKGHRCNIFEGVGRDVYFEKAPLDFSFLSPWL